jgi:aspartyl-tRNA(Asn)/glutamyl-tRNA(Gln) amidotransferase subunit A
MVHRLRVAGAVITGKTNTPEFALAGAINGKLTPPPTNPWNLAHTAGFSSAGAGSSVAVGMGPLALGTDSGGSVRTPAAFCGIYTLKPTYQRIPAVQVWRAGPDRSHTGPMTRTVRDSALLLQALAGFDPRDPSSDLPDEDYFAFAGGNVRNKRVAVSYDLGGTAGDVDPEVTQAIHDAAELLRDLGCQIIEADPPTIDTPEELEPGTWAYSGDHYHAAEVMSPDFWENHADDLTDQLRPVYETGRRALAWQYRRIVKRNRLFEAAIKEWFRPYDLLLTGAVGPAPRIDSYQVKPNRGGMVTGFFTMFNHAHVPAAAIPFGLHSNGMPLSVQIVGPPQADVDVLRISAAIEAARPWAHRWPALAEDLSLAAG